MLINLVEVGNLPDLTELGLGQSLNDSASADLLYLQSGKSGLPDISNQNSCSSYSWTSKIDSPKRKIEALFSIEVITSFKIDLKIELLYRAQLKRCARRGKWRKEVLSQIDLQLFEFEKFNDKTNNILTQSLIRSFTWTHLLVLWFKIPLV